MNKLLSRIELVLHIFILLLLIGLETGLIIITVLFFKDLYLVGQILIIPTLFLCTVAIVIAVSIEAVETYYDLKN